MMALSNGHVECVKVLEEQEGVDMDTRRERLSLDQMEEIGQEPWQQEALVAARELVRLVKGSPRGSGRRGRKKEEVRRGEEVARRKQAQEEMSDDKIDEIVQLLEPTTMQKNITKKKKARKTIQNVNAYSHNTNIPPSSEIETSLEHSNLHGLELIVDHVNGDKNLNITLMDKKQILEKEKVNTHTMENTNTKKLNELAGIIANIKESKSSVLDEIADIDSRKAQLLRSFDEKNSVLCRLTTEQEILKDVMSGTMKKAEAKTSKLESEVQTLGSKQLTTKKTTQTMQSIPENKEYLESISRKISSKEEELECPVCLDTATAPILMCENQHLICNECRLETQLM